MLPHQPGVDFDDILGASTCTFQNPDHIGQGIAKLFGSIGRQAAIDRMACLPSQNEELHPHAAFGASVCTHSLQL